MNAAIIRIQGIVQGVGFRPTVYRLAGEFDIVGFVRNDTGGVTIHAEGARIDEFIRALRSRAPRASIVREMTVAEISPKGYSDFVIVPSESTEGDVTSISPDLATCPECTRELLNPADRRFGYPFINCTLCGPRYSIVRELPYDRPLTTMSDFPMCEDCNREYMDVHDRRFHAQPNACEVCGPRYELLDGEGKTISCENPIERAARFLLSGKIVAVKGIGGFHLMADALNDDVVDELRRRKRRPSKPFAVMVKNIQTARNLCELSRFEAEILESPSAPILLVKMKNEPKPKLPESLAPGLDRLGVFLPYAPVHHLLFAKMDSHVLIATSGNRRDEPIVCDNAEAVEDLNGIADYFLVHNREIIGRSDDSVGFVSENEMIIVRRSRGIVPRSIEMPNAGPSVLAVGADLKGTFCLTRGAEAFPSPYFGDMIGEKSSAFFDEVLDRYLGWLDVVPRAVACDLHPDYLSTIKAERLAKKLGVPLFRVQHHYAHALSVVAGNRLPNEPVLALILDGFGYGGDGSIWGCEFLIVDYSEFERVGHLREVVQPGGDRAAVDVRRMALSWAFEAFGDRIGRHFPNLVKSLGDLAQPMMKIVSNGGAPMVSSAGRLFDTVACMAGICCENTYESECPQRLMSAFDPRIEGAYGFDFSDGILDPIPAIIEIADDVRGRDGASVIATRFHRGFANGLVGAARSICERRGISRVLLTGGVFQNSILFELVLNGLRNENLSPFWNRFVPPGDAGVALGQAMFAVEKLRGSGD